MGVSGVPRIRVCHAPRVYRDPFLGPADSRPLGGFAYLYPLLDTPAALTAKMEMENILPPGSGPDSAQNPHSP